MASGSSFSAVLTEGGSVYYAGVLGGRDRDGEKGWRVLVRGGDGVGGWRIVDVKAGLHYLAALEENSGTCIMSITWNFQTLHPLEINMKCS